MKAFSQSLFPLQISFEPQGQQQQLRALFLAQVLVQL
jgi:hypothetical protein